MKLEAIAGRGSRKDFVDLYFLCRAMPLREVFACFAAKFAGTGRALGGSGLLGGRLLHLDVARIVARARESAERIRTAAGGVLEPLSPGCGNPIPRVNVSRSPC